MPNNDDSLVYQTALAALLHDIGKFAQRAGCKDLYKREMEGQILPAQQGGHYSHNHALYTYGFLEEHLPEHLPQILRVQDVAQMAAKHHNPGSIEEQLVSVGDWAASGIDRRKTQENTELPYAEVPIVATLSLVRIRDRPPIAPTSLNLSRLDEYPSQTKRISQNQYAQLWNGFLDDWQRLSPANDIFSYLVTVDSLLERWTSYIPSATYKNEPDVSLYDHCRVASAFAACAYRYHEDKGTLEESAITKQGDKKWLFVYGDVQGIQKYMFDVKKNDKASKLIRARSFQIEALCKSASYNILRDCSVVPQCEIMNGGGNFILLLPNTEETKKILTHFERKLNGFLLKEYLGTLSLNVSFGPEVSLKDLTVDDQEKTINKTARILQEIHEANYKGKQKRFQSVLQRSNDHYIDYYYNKMRDAIDTGRQSCSFCDYRPAERQVPEEEAICEHCEGLVAVGTLLPKAQTMRLVPFNDDAQESALKRATFGFFPIANSAYDHAPDKGVSYSINSYGGSGPFTPFHPAPYFVPLDLTQMGEKTVMTFEEIAAKSKGTKKLAMFKADVDNLGNVFREGLGEHVTLSKYASLSRQLHYFFSVTLNQWIAKNYADSIYTVYSGGDDICVLGPWDTIFKFAQDLHDEFLKFCFENPSITISAGIALSASNTPIPFLAEQVEEQLSLAKAQPNKDSLSVFSVPMTWQEFSELYKDGKTYSTYLINKDLPVSLFRKLLNLSNRAHAMLVDCDVSGTNSLWLSQLKYTIARYREMTAYRIPAEFWDHLLMRLTSDHYQTMWKSKVSICYALYSVRTDKEKDEKEESHG